LRFSRTVHSGFGTDEISRVQQFMSAVAASLDRARLLDQLKAANAHLQEANKHKSVFLASMSHELRTPLNAILASGAPHRRE